MSKKRLVVTNNFYILGQEENNKQGTLSIQGSAKTI